MDFIGAYQPAYLLFMLKGFLLTLEIAAISVVLSFVIGLLIAVLRYTKLPVLTQVLFLWVEGIRNIPLLLIIFFTFFAMPEIGLNLTKTQAAIMALTIFESALISEIIRGGLVSIDRGQIEAARSSGLTFVQTLRFILLPQALRRMIPPLVSQFISLHKDTSLAVIIALPELMHSVGIVYSQNINYVFPSLLFAAMLYFVVNYSMSMYARRLEGKYAV